MVTLVSYLVGALSPLRCLSWLCYNHTQTIHNKYRLVINNSDLNYEHVVQLTQAVFQYGWLNSWTYIVRD